MTNLHRIVTQGAPNAIDLADYVGKHGEFLLDPNTGRIIFLDGTTPGGIAISGGALTGFATSLVTDTPNDSVNVSVLAASGGSADQDMVLRPAGAGALILVVPTGDSTGGNKRGSYAVDLQPFAAGKNSPTQVASGNYSFACGTGNTASGNQSHVEGWFTTASADAAHAEGFGTLASEFAAHAEGSGTTASNSYAHAEGQSCTAAGAASHAGGSSAQATADYSYSYGINTLADGVVSSATGQDSWTRGIRYMQSYATGEFASRGDQQAGRLCLKGHTTDASLVQLTSNGAAASTDNQFVIPNGASFAFTVTILGRAPSTGDSAMYTFTTLIKNDGGLNSLSGVTTPANTLWADTGAGSWQCVGSIDTDNSSLAVKVVGADATDIYWVAEVRSLELAIPAPPP